MMMAVMPEHRLMIHRAAMYEGRPRVARPSPEQLGRHRKVDRLNTFWPVCCWGRACGECLYGGVPETAQILGGGACACLIACAREHAGGGGC